MLVENMEWKSMFVSFNSSNKLPKIVSLQESSYNKVSKILYLQGRSQIIGLQL